MNKIPLWIIAFSLLTIAVCLVALVLRPYTGREPEREATRVESPAPQAAPAPAPARPARIASPARAASIAEAVESENPAALVVPQATQTVVQTSQTIVITPPMRGRALGAVSNETAASRVSGGRGSLIGRAYLTQNPPPEMPYDVTGSPECRHLADHPPTTQHYVLGADRGLGDVLIWLKPRREIVVNPVPESRIELTFTNCELSPRSVAVFPWSSFKVRNSDATRHVVQIRSANNLSPHTEAALDPGAVLEERPSKLFGTTNRMFISLRCGLHPWEQACVFLPSTPYAAITDSDGRYTINDVPAGNYRVEAFHRLATGTNGVAANLRVLAGGPIAWEFGLKPRPPQAVGQLTQQTPGTE